MKKFLSFILVIVAAYLLSFYFSGKSKGYSLLPDENIFELIEDWFDDIEDWIDDLDNPKVSEDEISYAKESFELGMEYYNNGDYADACLSFGDAFYYNPYLIEALYYKGLSSYFIEDYNTAFTDLVEYVYSDAEINDSAYLWLGKTSYQLQYYIDAVSYFQNFLDFYPNSEEAYDELIWSHYYNEDEASAEETAYKLLEINNKNTDAHFFLGFIYANNGEYQKSISHNLTVINIDESRYVADYNAAFSYYYSGKIDSSLYYLNKSLEINPEYELAYEFLTEIYYETGKYNDAISYATKTIELNSSTVESYSYRAKSYYSLGKYDEAIEDYKQYYELSLENTALYNIGLCYEKLGENETAIEKYSEFLTYSTDDSLRTEALRRIQKLDN